MQIDHIIEMSPIGIAVIDFNGCYRKVNPAYLALYGYVAEEMLGKKFTMVFPPSEHARVVSLHQNFLTNGGELKYECCVVRSDGALLEILSESVRVATDAGHLERLVYVLDITQRKQSEAKLRSSEETYRTLFETVSQGVVYHDTDGSITSANPAAQRILGLTLDQLQGRTSTDPHWQAICEDGGPFPGDQHPAMQALRTGQTVRGVVMGIHVPNREMVWIEVSATPQFKNGRLEQVYAIFEDITQRVLLNTQRMQAQNALRESDDRLKALIGSATDAIICIDSGHKIVLFNPSAQKMFGQTEAAMLGQTLDALIPQRYRAQHPEHVASFAQSDHSVRAMGGSRELFGLMADGTEFPIEASISRSLSHNENLFTVILRDITVRKAAQAALVQSQQELARSNADLEQFAYAASHDLIEPLRSVASCVRLLQKRYGDQLDARADEFIAHAVSGTTRMQALINDLLTFSKVSSEERQTTEISMESALSAATSNLQVAIAESRAQITHDPLPKVAAQGSQLTQLLQNLIANAIKFRGNKAPVVHVGVHREGTDWVFSVADNGIGIKPQHFSRVFELFKRLHARDEYPGTGIGLALCQKIVVRHGGRIWVESKPGEGTTFFFTLPVN